MFVKLYKRMLPYRWWWIMFSPRAQFCIWKHFLTENTFTSNFFGANHDHMRRNVVIISSVMWWKIYSRCKSTHFVTVYESRYISDWTLSRVDCILSFIHHVVIHNFLWNWSIAFIRDRMPFFLQYCLSSSTKRCLKFCHIYGDIF